MQNILPLFNFLFETAIYSVSLERLNHTGKHFFCTYKKTFP